MTQKRWETTIPQTISTATGSQVGHSRSNTIIYPVMSLFIYSFNLLTYWLRPVAPIRSIGHWQYFSTTSCSLPASPDLAICIKLFPSQLWHSASRCFLVSLYHVHPVGSTAGLGVWWNSSVHPSPFSFLYFHFYCRLLYSLPQLFILYFIMPSDVKNTSGAVVGEDL